MRQIGTIADATDARTFADYLLTLGITTRLDSLADGWAVWVHKEDLVPQAVRELEAFRQDPRGARYQGVSPTARELRRQAERAERLHRKNTIDLRGRLGPTTMARGPLTRALIVASIVVTVLTHFGDLTRPVTGRVTFTTYHFDERGRLHADGWEPIRRGELWRLVTPIFHHLNTVHLLFNMFALNDLGNLVEMRRGSRRLALLVLATAVVSNVAQFALPNLFSLQPLHGPRVGLGGGMSGVLYGLFGYAWMRGRYDVGSGLTLHPTSVNYMLVWLFICMTGWLGPIGNTAHVAGLLFGMLCGIVPYWRARFSG